MGGVGERERRHGAAPFADDLGQLIVLGVGLPGLVGEVGGAQHPTLRAVAAPEPAVTAHAVLLPGDDGDFGQPVCGELGRRARSGPPTT
jgi:hypothetical protein